METPLTWKILIYSVSSPGKVHRFGTTDNAVTAIVVIKYYDNNW